MITIQNTKFFTVTEVAQELKITPLTVRNYIKQGRLKGQRIGRPFLISEPSLKEFLNGSINGSKAVTEPTPEEEAK